MKKVEYRGDLNLVELTGTIKNLPDYCKYIPRPLIAFDLESFRRKRKEEDETESDDNRIIVFDDEEFHKNFQNGDRIKLKGEIQSRNFTRDNYEVDEFVVMAVKNYYEIWGEVPALKQPEGRQRQPIEWKKLLEFSLLPSVPEDSMFKEDGTKEKTKDSPFVYRVDENGEVYKETEHVAYEVVATKYQKIEEDLDLFQGDKNKVILIGKVKKQPYFDFLGSETKVPFCSFTVQTKSKFFPERIFYNNVITWSKIAEDTFAHVEKDAYVKVIGRLQSRKYEKEFTKRWKTPSGKRKKKKKVFELITREVSGSKIEIAEVIRPNS